MKKIITVGITLLAIGIASISNATIASSEMTSTSNSSLSTIQSEKVNLNTADAATIAQCGIKGIGLKRAQAIVDYRNLHGAFKTFDDLAKVKGIGQRFVKSHFDKLSEAFTIS